jgi:DNA-binding transcriptional LysR family regulator
MIAADFANGALVPLRLEDAAPQGCTMAMWAVFPAAAAPGPAGRWLIDRLEN